LLPRLEISFRSWEPLLPGSPLRPVSQAPRLRPGAPPHGDDVDARVNVWIAIGWVAVATLYYRIMYYGSRAFWNLRDSHMFETLKTLLAFYGPKSKAIIWAHNSHIGNAAATEMFPGANTIWGTSAARIR
jgi:erythromycin esterase-like protein